MDWNHDGKIDGHDMVYFHEVINSDSSSNDTNYSSGGNGNGYGNSSTTDDEKAKAIVILIGICVAYFVLRMMGFR
jgi:hypothetical protein